MIPYAAFKRDKVFNKKDEPLRVYGTLGDGELQKRVTAAIIGWCLPPDVRDFNFDLLDGETHSISDVLAHAANVPFLAERRVVHVMRAEALGDIGRSGGESKAKSSKISPAKHLSEGLKNLPSGTVLIMSRTPESFDPSARKKENRCINAALDKVLEDGKGGAGLIIDCTMNLKSAGTIIAMLESDVAAQGVAVERGAIQYLVERAGSDVALCANELEKCILRVGPGETVTRAVVEEMVKASVQDTIFTLVDAIVEGKSARAIGLMREMSQNNQPMEPIFTVFANHLRQLLQARALLDARLPVTAASFARLPPEIAAQMPEGNGSLRGSLQFMAWKARSLESQARNLSTAKIENALHLCLETDLALKGIEGDGGFESKNQSAFLLEMLIMKMA